MSCHLLRISYELFTKCMTPNVTRVHLTIISSWQVVTSMNFLGGICRNSSHYGTHWPESPRILPHTITSSSLIGTPNCVPWWKLNYLSCQCEACFRHKSFELYGVFGLAISHYLCEFKLDFLCIELGLPYCTHAVYLNDRWNYRLQTAVVKNVCFLICFISVIS